MGLNQSTDVEENKADAYGARVYMYLKGGIKCYPTLHNFMFSPSSSITGCHIFLRPPIYFIPVNSSLLHFFFTCKTSALSFFRVDNKVVFNDFLTAELTRISSEHCTQYQIKFSTNV